MATDLETAKDQLTDFLENPREGVKVVDAFRSIIRARDEEGLDLAADVLEIAPDSRYIDPLWDVVADGGAEEGVRTGALRALGAILVSARLFLDEPNAGEALLEREQLLAHVPRLTALYRDEAQPAAVRRSALEIAAMLHRSKDILDAGQDAFTDDDPMWVATGVFVLRNVLPKRARELVLGALQHADFAVVQEGITGLAELADPQDLEKLADLVFEGKPAETRAALWALAEVPEKKASEILAEAAKWLDGAAKDEARAANSRWDDLWKDLLKTGRAQEQDRGLWARMHRRFVLGDQVYAEDASLGDADTIVLVAAPTRQEQGGRKEVESE